MNVSQSLEFQALSNVCISRRFSSTPIPKIHLVDYDCLAVQLLLVFFPWPLLGFCKVRPTICFTFPVISSLIDPQSFSPPHAGGNGQGGHVVLELQQGHGARC